MTTRAMTKAARETVAGAATAAATAAVTVATMTPNDDKHNNQILSRYQR